VKWMRLHEVHRIGHAESMARVWPSQPIDAG
jgi:hypothetical protein